MSIGMTLRKARILSMRGATDGESAAAAAAAERILARWRALVEFCRQHDHMLADKEKRFLRQLRGNREPSDEEGRYIQAISAAIKNDPRWSAPTGGT
jgi:hypothetical protein